jgi:ATP-dependent exoDNAse (exonuclease V) beta subunit
VNKVKFIEDTHQYLLEDREMISVSALVGSFKEAVDWAAKAKGTAKKLTKAGTPTTAAQVLRKWEKKRDKASEIGTLLHSIKEQEVINKVDPVFYNKICSKVLPNMANGFKWSVPINQLQNDTVYPELMIYDEEHMICGQADKIIVTNNRINVWDYKTDYEIKFKGWSSEWSKAKRYLPPLQHLEECSGNTYSIKMSLYMYMLWKANNGRFLPGDLIIEHVHLKRDPSNDNIPVLEDGQPVILHIEQIKLPYRKKEVEAILKTIV